MKSLEEYVRIGIREELRKEGKTYRQIELMEEEIYQKVISQVAL